MENNKEEEKKERLMPYNSDNEDKNDNDDKNNEKTPKPKKLNFFHKLKKKKNEENKEREDPLSSNNKADKDSDKKVEDNKIAEDYKDNNVDIRIIDDENNNEIDEIEEDYFLDENDKPYSLELSIKHREANKIHNLEKLLKVDVSSFRDIEAPINKNNDSNSNPLSKSINKEKNSTSCLNVSTKEER